MLNNEIDAIAEQNNQISEGIARHEALTSMSQRDKDQLRQ